MENERSLGQIMFEELDRTFDFKTNMRKSVTYGEYTFGIRTDTIKRSEPLNYADFDKFKQDMTSILEQFAQLAISTATKPYKERVEALRQQQSELRQALSDTNMQFIKLLKQL